MKLLKILFVFFLLLFPSLFPFNLPHVRAQDTLDITEFQLPISGSYPYSITKGPDGNLWFTEYNSNQIGRITPGGNITEFPIPTDSSYPMGITAGPDGNIWFTEWGENGDNISRITPNGTITVFPLPGYGNYAYSITAGPDGNLWFILDKSEGNQIGRITPGGNITEFPIPRFAQNITTGPDGNLWFTESHPDTIGQITPNGSVTEFPLLTNGMDPWGIITGSDGNLWFTEYSSWKPSYIGRITPSGSVTKFQISSIYDQSYVGPTYITNGPDGNLWFTELSGNKIGRISINGTVTIFPVPSSDSHPLGITTGPDGNIWFTEATGNKIGRINLSNPASTVTDFKQTNPQWSTSPDKPINISTHLNHLMNCWDMWRGGCSVTAMADVFTSYGVLKLPDDITIQNPGSLNDWMTQNGAFSICETNWMKANGAANIGNPLFIAFNSPNWNIRQKKIDDALANGNLPIVGVQTSLGLHFIVLTKKLNDTPDYTIVDPALYPFSPNQTGKSGQPLSQAYGGFNKILYVIIFDKHALPQKSLTGVAHSPVQLLFTDPSGMHTGYQATTNTYIEDIPESAYGIMHGLSDDSGELPPMPDTLYFQQSNPSDGTYEVQVVGTGNGPYELDLSLNVPSKDPIVQTVSGIAVQSAVDTYVVTISSTSSTPILIQKKVQIDVMPGSSKNLVYPKAGLLPVAIIASPDISAGDIVVTSVRLGTGGARPLRNKRFFIDVNNDKIKDLLLVFKTKQAVINPNDIQICLTGSTKSGISFKGCDSIKVITLPKPSENLKNLEEIELQILPEIRGFLKEFDDRD